MGKDSSTHPMFSQGLSWLERDSPWSQQMGRFSEADHRGRALSARGLSTAEPVLRGFCSLT